MSVTTHKDELSDNITLFEQQIKRLQSAIDYELETKTKSDILAYQVHETTFLPASPAPSTNVDEQSPKKEEQETAVKSNSEIDAIAKRKELNKLRQEKLQELNKLRQENLQAIMNWNKLIAANFEFKKQQAKKEQAEKEQADKEEYIRLMDAMLKREQEQAEQPEAEQPEAEQPEAEQAEQEQAEREQAEQEQAEKEQAEREQAEREQAEKERQSLEPQFEQYKQYEQLLAETKKFQDEKLGQLKSYKTQLININERLEEKKEQLKSYKTQLIDINERLKKKKEQLINEHEMLKKKKGSNVFLASEGPHFEVLNRLAANKKATEKEIEELNLKRQNLEQDIRATEKEIEELNLKRQNLVRDIGEIEETSGGKKTRKRKPVHDTRKRIKKIRCKLSISKVNGSTSRRCRP